jgi:hypothetical protein
MKIKTNHQRYIESSEGTIRIEFSESHFYENAFHINMNFAFRKLNNKKFKHIGDAELYAYVGSVYIFEDMFYHDICQWEQDLVNKIWDFENQDYKKNYQKFEDIIDDDMVFSLDRFELIPEFRGKRMFKQIIDEFQNMYPFGTIILKPYPLGLDINDKKKITITMKKIKQSYKNCGFKPIDIEKEFYYLNIPQKVNVVQKNKDFFKQNTILWTFYHLEHFQEIIKDTHHEL